MKQKGLILNHYMGTGKTLTSLVISKNFPKKKDNLKSYPFKKWKDFLFCTLKESVDIDPIFSDIDNRLKGYHFVKLILNIKSSRFTSTSGILFKLILYPFILT